MKANELMIGDWVRARKYKSDCPPEVVKVRCCDVTDRIYAEKGNGLIMEFDRIEPIPLTPEILEKNGFNLQQSKGEYAPNIEGFSFDNCWVGDEFKWKTIPIKYVHELQHALKLCKIDKGIVL